MSTIQKQVFQAWQLSRKRSIIDDDKFTRVLSESRVDMTPHQVNAALFAFKSPFSCGAILADEVGLGKTIEAGIVMSQYWAMYKRRILVICPASLRKQWAQEMGDKFHLPTYILERFSFNELQRKGFKNPFTAKNEIVICSYDFFKRKHVIGGEVKWDLVVFDEAHKLRNVYKKGAVTANIIKEALSSAPKLMLTATPLQNNIQELYGLISVLNNEIFGSSRAFSHKYGGGKSNKKIVFNDLKERLKPYIHRSLRKQVKEYVNYTKRISMLTTYEPTDIEMKLYNGLNEYLLDENSIALPSGQRTLLILVVRKQMASSCYAVSQTLNRFIIRLERMKNGNSFAKESDEDVLISALGHNEDLLINLNEDEQNNYLEDETISKNCLKTDCNAIQSEINKLKELRDLALSITHETKANNLVLSLEKAFKQLTENNAPRKALIFTESTRTQAFLVQFLSMNGYQNKIVCFNGSNSDNTSEGIYREWLNNPKNRSRITNAKAIDKRQAIVDYFKTDAEIMIATEAAAEGINLQFCSLVVNYDLPWNPQRVEQRIGRCHRYGQKHDVVVLNFVNEKNAADKRVYQLLKEKFCLFDGVFGTSDDILGSIESGVDFERRLFLIMQNCRSTTEIENAFDHLQEELEDVIQTTMKETRNSLLENFDQNVVEKLNIQNEKNIYRCSLYQKQLMDLTVNFYHKYIDYVNYDQFTFELIEQPYTDKSFELGKYYFSIEHPEAKQFKISDPLGERMINRLKEIKIPQQELTFLYDSKKGKVSILEQQLDKSGYLLVKLYSSKNEYDGEEQVLTVSITEDGELLPTEFGTQLLLLETINSQNITIPATSLSLLNKYLENSVEKFKDHLGARNNAFIDDEMERIVAYHEDLIFDHERELNEQVELKKSLKKDQKKATGAEKIHITEQISKVMTKIRKLRIECDELEERFMQENTTKAQSLRSFLKIDLKSQELFTLRWTLIK